MIITTSPAKTNIPAELNRRCYIHLSSRDNIINHGKEGAKFWPVLPDKTYFAIGVNGAKEGAAYFMCWDGGTRLTPIFDESGKQIILPQYAGKVLHREQMNVKFTNG
jgi:hypothetical protein